MDSSKVLLGKALYVARLLGWVLSLGGNVWSLVAWISGGGIDVFGPPEYAASIVIFSVVLIYCSWHLYQPFRPSRRLAAMADEIKALRDHVEGRNLQSLSGLREEQARVIARRLDGLQVPYPPIKGENAIRNWHTFLIHLQAEARSYQIDRARSLWKTLQEADTC